MDDYTNYNNYGPGPRHSGRSGGRRPGRLKKLLWLIPLAIFLLVAAFDSFYTLKEDQYAVITTFGKPTTVSASGLQFKIPFGPSARQRSLTTRASPVSGVPISIGTRSRLSGQCPGTIRRSIPTITRRFTSLATVANT